MCEYCGCQSLTPIDELTREHDMAVELIGDARAAHRRGDVDAMADLARRITATLGPHTRVEEDGLFPALSGDFPEQMAALTAEHRVVEAVLNEADQGTPADPTWPARLIGVLALLRRHMLKEQDGVFPAALASLSVTDWETIDAVRRQVGSVQPEVTTS